MASDQSPMVASVLELSRQVLVQSKHLADLINVEGTTEDAIIDSAKVRPLVATRAKRAHVLRRARSSASASVPSALHPFPAHAPSQLTAGITAQLYNTLAEAVQHGSSDQLRASLLNSAKEVRSAILDLIQSTKDALLNPFDFQATQKVQNCCVTVATNVKEVIAQVQALERGAQSDAGKIDGDKVKNCASALSYGFPNQI